jgi:hypothetical protein
VDEEVIEIFREQVLSSAPHPRGRERPRCQRYCVIGHNDCN